MTATLVSGMANMRVSDHPGSSSNLPLVPKPVNGQQLNVQYMNNDQQKDLKAKIDRLCVAEQKLAEAERKIAQADAKIAKGNAQQEQGRAIKEDAKDKIIQGLDTFAITLLKRKENQTDAVAISRIDALRQKVISAKTNLPTTAAGQQQLLTQLQKEAQELFASLKKV